MIEDTMIDMPIITEDIGTETMTETTIAEETTTDIETDNV